MDEQQSESDQSDQVLRLADDFMRRCRAQERPTIAEYASLHPELSREINEVFPIVAMLERACELDTETNAHGRIQTLSFDGHAERSGQVEATTEPELIPDSMFGRYRILETLGRGAMGVVYRATDTELDREVALKIPALHRSDATTLKRFRREARAMATVSHRNLCAVYDAGDVDGTCFLSMACIRGRSLADLLQAQSRLTNEEAAGIVLKLAEAMTASHAAGVVHRDLKPANIIIDSMNEPVITDFGLAVRQQNSDPTLTRAGAIVGSPAYMSPEQVSEGLGSVGPATDIYSLGVILYELISGRRPYEGTVLTVLGQIVSGAAIPSLHSLQAKTSPRLDKICRTAMARAVIDRYSSAKALADDLREYLLHGYSATDTFPPLEDSTRQGIATVPGLKPGLQRHDSSIALKRRTIGSVLAVTAVVAIIAAVTWKMRNPQETPNLDAPVSSRTGIFLAGSTPLGNRSFAGTTGNQFAVGDTDIVITALGFEDPGHDGLTLSHKVALWTDAGAMLAIVNVPSGSAARLVDGWRYVDVPPVTLTAGAMYVLGAETTQHDDFFTDAGESPGVASDFDLGPLLSPGSNRIVFYYETFQFPTLESDVRQRWAPGNALGHLAVSEQRGTQSVAQSINAVSESLVTRRSNPTAASR